MKKELLEEKFAGIKPLDEAMLKEAAAYQESLVKPPGSLGTLEEISIKLAGITGQLHNKIEKTGIEIFSADNGVVKQGVASAPQTVTWTQTINFTKKLSGVGSLAKTFGVDLLVTDVGGVYDYPEEFLAQEFLVTECCEGRSSQKITGKIVDKKIAHGTKDLSEEAAMTEDQACQALEIGFEAAQAMAKAGYDVVGIGEMGIGNTTTSASILSYLLGKTAEETVGKGGGVDKAGFARKKEIVDLAIKRIETKDDDLDQIIEIFKQVGGFDIAAMTGAFLGAAVCGMPVVIDGYISVVAALCAVKINPLVKGYMFSSHRSKEPGYELAIKALELNPMLELGMRLGEGSGCPLAFEVMKAACGVMNEMATFEESKIDTGYLDNLDRKEDF